MTTSRSQGDPRVLFVLNLVLSFAFSAFVVWGLELLQVTTFTWQRVGLATATLMLLTWLIVLR
jgi:hypothetical protein